MRPDHRRTGLATELYDRFFAAALQAGAQPGPCDRLAQNEGSISFHRQLGFTVSAPINEHDGPGLDRVTFERRL